MSVNLYCNKIDLVQTPSYITHMCTEPFGDYLTNVEFAIAALKQYRIWLKYGISYDVPVNTKPFYEQHIAQIQALIDNPPDDLEVYII